MYDLYEFGLGTFFEEEEHGCFLTRKLVSTSPPAVFLLFDDFIKKVCSYDT